MILNDTNFCSLSKVIINKTEPLFERVQSYKYGFWLFKVTLKISDTAALSQALSKRIKTISLGLEFGNE